MTLNGCAPDFRAAATGKPVKPKSKKTPARGITHRTGPYIAKSVAMLWRGNSLAWRRMNHSWGDEMKTQNILIIALLLVNAYTAIALTRARHDIRIMAGDVVVLDDMMERLGDDLGVVELAVMGWHK